MKYYCPICGQLPGDKMTRLERYADDRWAQFDREDEQGLLDRRRGFTFRPHQRYLDGKPQWCPGEALPVAGAEAAP